MSDRCANPGRHDSWTRPIPPIDGPPMPDYRSCGCGPDDEVECAIVRDDAVERATDVALDAFWNDLGPAYRSDQRAGWRRPIEAAVRALVRDGIIPQGGDS